MMTLGGATPQNCRSFPCWEVCCAQIRQRFSAIAIDQAHEEANAVIKGDGGAAGITEGPSALRKWMVAGPAVSQLVAQYEGSSELRDMLKQTKHLGQTPTDQKRFLEKVLTLTNTLEEMGNPLQEETEDLFSLDNKDIASPDSAAKIATHLSTGKASFEARLEALEQEDTSSFHARQRRTSSNKKSSALLQRRR